MFGEFKASPIVLHGPDAGCGSQDLSWQPFLLCVGLFQLGRLPHPLTTKERQLRRNYGTDINDRDHKCDVVLQS